MHRFYMAAVLAGTLSFAQPVEAPSQKIDPRTFIFEDGRTTLTDYVVGQLREHTNCCGIDNIYVELRITPQGTVENVRSLTGRNDCYKRSLEDVLRPTLWKVEGFSTTRPLYYEFRLSEACKGTPEDNVYKPIPVAAPAVAAEPPKKEEPKPVALTPSVPGVSPPKEKPAEEPLSPPTEKPEKKEVQAPKPTPKSSAPKPLPPREEEEVTEAPTPPPSEPARRGYQPGKEPPKESRPPNPPAVVGKLPENLSPLTVQVPKGYKSTGEKRPPQEHIGSYVNTTGPRYAEPDYINGPIAKAIYLKQEYRKRGVCGLVHVLLEIAIDAQGNVRGYRILRANRPDVEIATPQVLAGMKYKPVPLPMVFYTEFKIDVDCQSDQKRIKLDTVSDFLSTQDGKLIRPSAPQNP